MNNSVKSFTFQPNISHHKRQRRTEMKQMKFWSLTLSFLLAINLLVCQTSFATMKQTKTEAVKKSITPPMPKHEPLSITSLEPKEFNGVMSDMASAYSNQTVIDVIEKKFPNRSLRILSEIRQWANDSDVQKALVRVLRPKYSQAPFYWDDQQIINCSLFQTEQHINKLRLKLEEIIREAKAEIALNECEKYREFRPDIRRKLVAHQLPTTNDWLDAYMALANKKQSETIRRCIIKVTGELSKNENLSLQDIGAQAMQDTLVQKILVDSMTPMPVHAFASFTETQITDFIKSAGIIFGEIYGEALVATNKNE